MKNPASRILSTAFALATLAAFAAPEAGAAHTRVTYPSAIGVEVLGRSMLYSVFYDQVVNDNIAAGVGYGSVGMNDQAGNDANKTMQMVPVYMNYYFVKDAGSPFVTGGVTLITNHTSVKGLETATGNLDVPTSNVMPVFGGGYENRGDNGFLFRVAGYLEAAKSLTPWVGFAFGYAF